MTKVHQIRKEFDEPFKDVLAGFALMGYSKRATAQILEINWSYFQTLAKRYAPDTPWKAYIERNDTCKPKGKGWPKGLKGKNGMTKEAWERRRKHDHRG